VLINENKIDRNLLEVRFYGLRGWLIDLINMIFRYSHFIWKRATGDGIGKTERITNPPSPPGQK
jgi:hypothetical protein